VDWPSDLGVAIFVAREELVDLGMLPSLLLLRIT
jgi:hypothetical protein